MLARVLAIGLCTRARMCVYVCVPRRYCIKTAAQIALVFARTGFPRLMQYRVLGKLGHLQKYIVTSIWNFVPLNPGRRKFAHGEHNINKRVVDYTSDLNHGLGWEWIENFCFSGLD